MRRAALVLAGLLALTGCDRPPEPAGKDAAAPAAPAASAFSYDAANDLSGYYLPASEVRVGKWGLHDVFVGQRTDFDDWRGGTRTGTFAPVMIEFEDVTSEMMDTENGEARAGQARVIPTRYSVTDSTVHFEGDSAELGRVTFDGRLDAGALATARRNLGDDGVVMTGTLVAGGQTVPNVSLHWFGGD